MTETKTDKVAQIAPKQKQTDIKFADGTHLVFPLVWCKMEEAQEIQDTQVQFNEAGKGNIASKEYNEKLMQYIVPKVLVNDRPADINWEFWNKHCANGAKDAKEYRKAYHAVLGDADKFFQSEFAGD